MESESKAYHTIRLYNTLSRKDEEFTPIEKGEVRLYVCGPTVYDDAHLGHARCYITWDLLYRFLTFMGYKVKYSRNITDVDDKILNRAAENGEDPRILAERFIEKFHKVMDALNTEKPTYEPRATEYVPKMVEFISKLVEKGYAYVAESKTVYFDISKFESYGELCHQNLEDLQSGARVEPDPEKKSPLDFALWKPREPLVRRIVTLFKIFWINLWKPASEGESLVRRIVTLFKIFWINLWKPALVWPSPWGWGRPGWHIECSAMSLAILGEQLDIHAGGMDLIFPHHQNEIAQSEAFTGKRPFVRHWMHNGFVNVSGEKMSKSLGNFSTVEKLLETYDSDTIRYFILTHHYRSPVDFTDEALEGAKNWVKKKRDLVSLTIRTLENHYRKNPRKGSFSLASIINSARQEIESIKFKDEESMENLIQENSNNEMLLRRFLQWREALAHDLGTPIALSIFSELTIDILHLRRTYEQRVTATRESFIPMLEELLGVFLVLSETMGFDFNKYASNLNLDLESELEPLRYSLSMIEGNIPYNSFPDDLLYDPETYMVHSDLVYLICRKREFLKTQKEWDIADQLRNQLAEIGIQLKDNKDGTTTWSFQNFETSTSH